MLLWQIDKARRAKRAGEQQRRQLFKAWLTGQLANAGLAESGASAPLPASAASLLDLTRFVIESELRRQKTERQSKTA